MKHILLVVKGEWAIANSRKRVILHPGHSAETQQAFTANTSLLWNVTEKKQQGTAEKLHNVSRHILWYLWNTFRIIRAMHPSRIWRCTQHARQRWEMRLKIWPRNVKRPFGRPRGRWEFNIQNFFQKHDMWLWTGSRSSAALWDHDNDPSGSTPSHNCCCSAQPSLASSQRLDAWFQAFAGKEMRTALFWAVTQRVVVIP